MKKAVFILLFGLLSTTVHSQKRDNIWPMGYRSFPNPDYFYFDFSNGQPDTVRYYREMPFFITHASICDTTGNLLFYTNGQYIANKDNDTLLNSQNFNPGYYTLSYYPGGLGFSQAALFLPFSDTSRFYYVISESAEEFIYNSQFNDAQPFHLTYSIIDASLDSGRGGVLPNAKNINIINDTLILGRITACKHANGRDWWVIFRKSDFSVGSSNNDWYTYLITPYGIQNFSVQSIGSQNHTNNGQICFSQLGDKVVFSNLMGLLELFNFDRCNGLLSNPIIIEPEPTIPPAKYFWSCAFSPDASKLYVSTNETPTYLFQYDLNSPNIAASKDTIYSLSYPLEAGGELKLAPDNKIYLSNWYFNGFQTPYPYQDTVYNMYNMNLSVINQPDSLGTACDFQPFSFYLGGKRTYYGLPNNPNYDLGALTGSVCDTITGVAPSPLENPDSYWEGGRLYPNPAKEKVRFEYSEPVSENSQIEVYDNLGVMVKKIILTKGSISTTFSINDLPPGMYLCRVFINNAYSQSNKLIIIR